MPKIDDIGKSSSDKALTGGKLFRRYLLNRCQVAFEGNEFITEAQSGPGPEVSEGAKRDLGEHWNTKHASVLMNYLSKGLLP